MLNVQEVKVAGVDIGNDALKIAMTEDKILDNGEVEKEIKTWEVMNVVAEGYNRRVLSKEEGHLSNLLDVNISMLNEENKPKKMGRYFVGGLAYKEGRGDILERTSEDVKAESENSVILLVTGMAYALYDPNRPTKIETVAIGSVLPTEEFFNENKDLVSIFKENFLNKTFIVKFNSPTFNGAEITIKFVDMEVQPEGAAAQLHYGYNIDGSEKAVLNTLKNEIVLGVIVGSITTELWIYDHGKFDSRGFKGIPIGTSDPLDKIADQLDTEYGVELNRHHLDYIIRNKKSLVINNANVTEGNRDITEELKEFSSQKFSFFTKQLVNKINKELDKKGINTSLINRVLLGGGGITLILNDFIKEFRKGNSNLIDNPRYANAIGALILIMIKQISLSEAAAEVFEETNA